MSSFSRYYLILVSLRYPLEQYRILIGHRTNLSRAELILFDTHHTQSHSNRDLIDKAEVTSYILIDKAEFYHSSYVLLDSIADPPKCCLLTIMLGLPWTMRMVRNTCQVSAIPSFVYGSLINETRGITNVRTTWSTNGFSDVVLASCAVTLGTFIGFHQESS